jgi:hypothetical protein
VKWVRVELRRVEVIPPGGPQNTFYDFVGPGAVNLWSAQSAAANGEQIIVQGSGDEQYGLLRSQDFPFNIRIPESIPPSIALENRAGIKYELIGSVCTKGKRSVSTMNFCFFW